jgi:putative molybdopterin biosynthesis protein
MERLRNDIRRRRQHRSLTQQQLARRAEVSRQSLNALELGRAVPSTSIALRLAQVLECHVEELFWLTGSPAPVDAEIAGGDEHSNGRAVVASVEGKWVAHRLAPTDGLSAATPADAILKEKAKAGGPAHARLHLLSRPDVVSTTLLCAGCAPAMGILAARSSASGVGRMLWLDRPSLTSLELLRRGQVHVAGAHLLDEATGEFNVPEVQRLFGGRAMLVFNLLRWQSGIVVPPRNPKRIRSAADLWSAGLRIVQRAPAAAAQQLLLRLAGSQARHLQGPPASSHLEAARMVAVGLADAAIAIESAARAFELKFIPLAEERFDLVVPRELAQDARVMRLLDTATTHAFRQDVEGLGGLTTRQSGSLIAKTAA